MKTRLRASLALSILLLLALAACGQSTAAANEVSMVASDFSTTSITIQAGQAVHFTDPPGTGATHVICLGTDGTCDNVASGPQALEGGGFTINAGDPAKDITFSTAGT